MKIAVLSCDADPTNGWGNLTVNFCRALHEKKQDFTLFLPRDCRTPACDWQDRISSSLPARHLAYGSARFIKTARAAADPYEGFDVIHALFAVPPAYIAYKAARKFSKPFIMGAQGTYAVMPFLKFFDRSIFKKILDRADRIIVPSRFTRDAILHFHHPADFEKRMRIIHNGIDFKRFNRCYHARTTEPSPENGFIGIGALKPRKGFDITIRAFKGVIEKQPGISYKIVGDGPEKYRNHLKSIAEEAGIAKHIQFLGTLPDQALEQEMSRAYAYIHTPVCVNWNFEGFGMVYVEANACGIPVIGSRSGGVPDAVKHGSSGLLCKENDVDSAAASMMEIIENRNLYDTLCRGALEWAEAHDWSKIADQYIACYRELLSQ